MLILAGVSINAIVGEDGILRQAQIASFMQKIAIYKEEMEMNIVGNSEDFVPDMMKVTAINNSIKRYIPSIADNDVGKFGIIAGELYYLGDDSIEKQVSVNQGLNTKPDDVSADEYISIIEKKAVDAILQSLGVNAFEYTNENSEKVVGGIPLYNKDFEHMAEWRIIVESEGENVNAVYGTGWHFVPEGTDVEGIGTVTSNYIINYNTKKAVKYDLTKHNVLSYETVLAVKDGLVFNIDPGLTEDFYNELKAGKPVDTSLLGDGVEFHGYGSENGSQDLLQAFTASAFIFDGKDDYIKLPYKISKSFQSGQTFEFYGKIQADTVNSHTWYTTETTKEPGRYLENIVGFFTGGYGGNTDWTHSIRYTYITYPKTTYGNYVTDKASLYFNICGTMVELDENDDRYRLGTKWDQDEKNTSPQSKNIDTQSVYDIILEVGKVFDICITVNPDTQKLALYLDGKLVVESDFYADRYQETIKEAEKLMDSLMIGRTTAGGSNFWHYMTGECYSLKLYNRGLSAEEVADNYKATKEYHDFLEKGGNASTVKSIKGEDLENITEK